MPKAEQTNTVTPSRPAQLQPIVTAADQLNLDAAIAEEAEAMLDADFESVSDVLDGAMNAHAEELQPFAPQGAVAASTPEAPAERTGAAEFTEAEISEPIPHASERAKTEESAQAEPFQKQEAPVVEAAAAPVESQPSEKRSPQEKTPPPAPEPAAKSPDGSSRWSFALWPLFQLLLVLNFPLRWVPPKLRPLLDVLALSLVFWIPIVWAMAWVWGGR